MTPASLIITLAMMAGQIVKIPVGSGGGATLIDVAVIDLCLLGLFQTKLRLIKPPAFIISALLFSLMALFSLILTPLQLKTHQYLSSLLYLVRFSSYILLSWLLLSKALPSLKQDINQVLLLSGVGLAILGLLQFIFFPDLRFLAVFGWDPHYYRTSSTFLDPNFLGAFFVLTLLLLFSEGKQSYGLFSEGKQSYGLFQILAKSKKWVIYFILVYLALLTTFSRSSYGMFLLSFLTLAFLKRSVKVAILAIFLFGIFLFSFQIQIRAVNRVTPLDRGQTASFRLSTWRQGFEIFLKNPLLGMGFNTYNFALKQYNLGDEQFLQGRGSTTNDSSLLHVLSTTGILGLLIYLSFLVNLAKLGLAKNPIFTAAVFGLLGHSIFVNSLFYPFILIWIILSASSLYGKSVN